MAIVRVGTKHQVVIPREVFSKLRLSPGDYVEISARNNEAVIKRKRVVDDFPVTDEPLGPKARAALRRGLRDLAQGRVSGPFRTTKELKAHHDSLKKKSL